jgi:hypothetical protein
MLTEYALTPDIFDASCYSKPELYNPLFSNLIKPLLEEGIVRNLRDGEWIKYVSNYVNNETSTLYPIAKNFLKQLILTNRLRRFPATSANEPKNYQEWCGEAFGSHEKDALNGIIVSEEIKKDRKFKKESKIGSIEKLYLCNWWNKRSSSTRVSRSIEDYMDKLNLVLSHANHLMFIDPNIDPSQGNYRDFYQLLIKSKRPNPQLIIEIHRKLSPLYS